MPLAPELEVLLVAPLDDAPLDEVAPELADDELASPLEEEATLLVVSSPPPHATTTQIPMTTNAPLMVRS
jgi:hypothetical protein